MLFLIYQLIIFKELQLLEFFIDFKLSFLNNLKIYPIFQNYFPFILWNNDKYHQSLDVCWIMIMIFMFQYLNYLLIQIEKNMFSFFLQKLMLLEKRNSKLHDLYFSIFSLFLDSQLNNIFSQYFFLHLYNFYNFS